MRGGGLKIGTSPGPAAPRMRPLHRTGQDAANAIAADFNRGDLKKEFRRDGKDLKAAEVETLRMAVKLGGSEFLRRVLEECDRIVKSPNELPSPIDPAQFV